MKVAMLSHYDLRVVINGTLSTFWTSSKISICQQKNAEKSVRFSEYYVVSLQLVYSLTWLRYLLSHFSGRKFCFRKIRKSLKRIAPLRATPIPHIVLETRRRMGQDDVQS